MKERLKIKVCGLVYPENIEKVCALGPDYIGFIFYPDSIRYVGKQPDPAIFRIPGEGIKRVGVFVNEEIDQVQVLFATHQLHMVQLHGSESPQYCMELTQQGIEVIKALTPDAIRQPGRLQEYEVAVSTFLIDNPGQGHGGTGHKFNWEILEGVSIPRPFLLSGGIGPGDAFSIGQVTHHRLSGIDVNSRFEVSPGVKHIQHLKTFIEEIRLEVKD